MGDQSKIVDDRTATESATATPAASDAPAAPTERPLYKVEFS